MAKAKTNPVPAPTAISELSEANVMSVYSGRDGECCCGCKGKYYYAEAHREAAVKDLGYDIDDDAVSDRMVRRVIKIIKENAATAETGTNNVAVVIGTRLYIAYLLPTV